MGQIRIQKKERIIGNNYRNPIAEDRMILEKLVSRYPTSSSQIQPEYDSAERIPFLDLEDGELRKILASPLYIRVRGSSESSRRPTASGKPEAVIKQKRGASAQRTQADHSRRESLMSSSSQELRASGKPNAMLSSRSYEPGNQCESSIF